MRNASMILALAFAVVATPAHAQAGAGDRPDGAAIYRDVCRACHMADGRGADGAGAYPALAGDPRLASALFAASVVANGRHNMPHFAPQPELSGFEAMVAIHLDDAEIAAVVNYVRSHFGNRYDDTIDAAAVAKLH